MDDVSPKLKAFLDFVMGISSDDPFVRKLEARVNEAKKNPNWRREFMTLSMLMQDERELGLEQGRAEGRASTLDAATTFMLENGISPELVSKFRSSFSANM